MGFHRPGTLRLATTETRYDEFRRYVARDYFKEGDVCRTTLISPDEVKHKAPLLDTSKVRIPVLRGDKGLQILGALYTSGDGYIDTRGLTRALAKGAEMGGATVLENCPPIQLELRSDGSWNVTLEGLGTVCTRNVVNASGPCWRLAFPSRRVQACGHRTWRI